MAAACCIAREARLPSSDVVVKRRQVAVMVAIVVAFWLDAAWAKPLRIAEEARAVVCCAENCSRLHAVVCDSGCCPTTKRPDDFAAPTIAKHDPTVTSLVVEPSLRRVDAVHRPSGDIVAFSAGGNDPRSIFLLTRTLRL